MADKERTHGGHTHTQTQEADTGQGLEAGQSRHTADNMVDIYVADKVCRRCQSGLKADARLTHGGRKADPCRHVADTWRTNGRQGLEAGRERT